MQKRSKIQWMFYLKENFWDLPKNSKLLQKKYWETPNISSQQNKAAFQKFTKKKWADLINQFSRKNKESYSIILKKRLLKKRRYFKTMLQQKHRFKLLYAIKKEKKFKKLLRTSFKYQNEKQIFDSLVINRLDTILVSLGYVKQKYIAQILINSGLVLINNTSQIDCAYQIKLDDIISIDDRIKLYISKNLEKTKQVFSVFEINYKTLDAVLLENKNFIHTNDTNKISLDFVRRYYKK